MGGNFGGVGSAATVEFIKAGADASRIFQVIEPPKVFDYDPFNSSVVRGIRVKVKVADELGLDGLPDTGDEVALSDIIGLWSVRVTSGAVQGYTMADTLCVLKAEFVNLDGDPIGIIDPLGGNLVDDAIAMENAEANDPFVTVYRNPLFMRIDLPAAFDSEKPDVVSALVTCRQTGEATPLTLTEQVVPFDFADDAGEFSIHLTRGSITGFGDDPDSLRTDAADTLVAEVSSRKFARPFADTATFYETGLESRTFATRSVSGTMALSALDGPGRTLQVDLRRDAAAVSAVLSETGPDVFESPACRVRILPSAGSGSTGDLHADAPDKLLAVVTAPAQGIEDGVMLAFETDDNSLCFTGGVPSDSIVGVATASGNPRPAATPTLAELDRMVVERKAYRIRISGWPLLSPDPPNVTINSLDSDGRVKEHIKMPLVRDPRHEGVWVSEKPILPFDGPHNAALSERYGEEYGLLQASNHEVSFLSFFLGFSRIISTLRPVIIVGDSLGAGMQSTQLYSQLESKGFASLLTRAFGWAYRSPGFRYSRELGIYGWPAGPYDIQNDVPFAPAAPELYWGALDLDRAEEGFMTGNRLDLSMPLNNFSVPGFEIQNLMRTSGAPKDASKGENPAPVEEWTTWHHRLSRMNRMILGSRTSVEEVAKALPNVVVFSIGGNDLLESVTVRPYGDPDCVMRNDADGANPDPSNVTWLATCDAPLVSGGKPAGYDPADFSEYVTRPSIFEAELRRILDALENAYGASHDFGRVTERKNKPVILLNKVPDISKIPLLLSVGQGEGNVRAVGRLPFACRRDGVGDNLAFMEHIRYYVDPAAPGTYTEKARVSLLAVLARAIVDKDTEFGRFGEEGLLGKKKQKDVLEGSRKLKPIKLDAQYVLSDEEIDFLNERRESFNAAIDAAVNDNKGGDGTWPHIRIVAVDMNAAFDRPPGSLLGLGRVGGLFSLDLVHPNSQGYKLLANKYIEAINALIAAGEFFGVPTTQRAATYTVP